MGSTTHGGDAGLIGAGLKAARDDRRLRRRRLRRHGITSPLRTGDSRTFEALIDDALAGVDVDPTR
jgi:hypothetical protein